MLESEVRDALLSLSTPLLADARSSLGLPEGHLDNGIRPVVPFSRMLGSAVTVRLEVATQKDSADLTPLITAYESQSEASASIIVIQVPVELHDRGIFGEGAATMARKHGYVGALVEGAVRDTHDLMAMEFPVFSRHVTPGYIMGMASAVAVGVPVLVGGRTIHQGDVIVGDNDGVVVIRPDELNDVTARAQAVREWEDRFHGLLAAGTHYGDIEGIVGPMP